MSMGLLSFVLLPLPAQAASVKKSKTTSTYYAYSRAGDYKQIKVSGNFAGAKCNSNDLSKGKSATYRFTSGSKPKELRCVTPKDNQSYQIAFYRTLGATEQPDNDPVKIDITEPRCLFVHSSYDNPEKEEAIRGLNKRMLEKNSDGSCKKDAAGVGVTADPDKPAPKAKKPKVQKPKKKDTVSVKKFQGLKLPPNFSESQKNEKNYFLVPGSIGDKDYATHRNSPPSNRYGTKIGAAVFYDTALKYKAKYNKSNTKHPSKLMLADFNASIDHGSHCDGINFDVYTTDKSATVSKKLGGNQDRSVELAKMFIRTGKVKVIFFNDPDVIRRVNSVYPGKVQPEPGLPSHEYHFHVRLKDGYAGKEKSAC